MKGRHSIVTLLLTALACTADTDKSGSDTAASSDTAATAAAGDSATKPPIDSLRNLWRDAANKDDAAGVANLYADDAVFAGSGVPVASGRTAIQQAFTQTFPVSEVKRIDSKEFVTSGDLAYDHGEYEQEIRAPNTQPRTERGHYVVILRRQGDGSWKIVKHIATVPAPAQ